MRILAFETTCDETSAGVLENGKILSNVVFSQIKIHRRYKGVVPELASRAHAEKIALVLKKALSDAGIPVPLFRKKLIDAVVYARGPGLPGALLVGRTAAETAAKIFGSKLIGVNHLEGHLLAYEFEGGRIKRNLDFPLIALIVSGGHTELWRVRGYGRYEALGRTRDDAAGEAFDKVAKLLGLDYPGGPAVEKEAAKCRRYSVEFPRPCLKDTFDFSFSGLKTAVAYYLRDKSQVAGRRSQVTRYKIQDKEISEICASFQEAVVDTLVFKALAAVEKFRTRRLIIGGGVAANSRLREKFAQAAVSRAIPVGFAEKEYCTDNAAMIALCGYRRLLTGKKFLNAVDVDSELKIENWK
ncbi:MAG: tRNA (adenosine(37)-N6)-threonylcarbamoyltransferase complex transferase subunit TsaD [Elusimicrobia bacterium]|nr:tRNA (adenosine(37)-N6)-threonylcarbamoyltransferase complex transferase subunit TsaD [Elusimicrobiota bacterium]